MLGIALIVFRETLEAALLIGIVAAATRGLAGRNPRLVVGILLGVSGALLVAAFTGRIAELADGAGQELFNATVLGVAVLMLGWHNIWMARHGRQMATQARALGAAVQDGRREMSALVMLIALAVLREGSETALFVYSVALGDQTSLVQLWLGGIVGLVVGGAIGWVLYAGLARIPLRYFFQVTGALIVLLAAGLAGQSARYLARGDFVETWSQPIWDTSSWLSTESTIGQLLHLLVGYEARPSGMQLTFYVATAALILTGMWWNRRVETLRRRATLLVS
ncbi:MAG: FTR1 family protein [Chromatiaceae bacterium]|nr:FTR1 family protein [Chromatiaceae bacterium]